MNILSTSRSRRPDYGPGTYESDRRFSRFESGLRDSMDSLSTSHSGGSGDRACDTVQSDESSDILEILSAARGGGSSDGSWSFDSSVDSDPPATRGHDNGGARRPRCRRSRTRRFRDWFHANGGAWSSDSDGSRSSSATDGGRGAGEDAGTEGDRDAGRSRRRYHATQFGTWFQKGFRNRDPDGSVAGSRGGDSRAGDGHGVGKSSVKSKGSAGKVCDGHARLLDRSASAILSTSLGRGEMRSTGSVRLCISETDRRWSTFERHEPSDDMGTLSTSCSRRLGGGPSNSGGARLCVSESDRRLSSFQSDGLSDSIDLLSASFIGKHSDGESSSDHVRLCVSESDRRLSTFKSDGLSDILEHWHSFHETEQRKQRPQKRQQRQRQSRPSQPPQRTNQQQHYNKSQLVKSEPDIFFAAKTTKCRASRKSKLSEILPRSGGPRMWKSANSSSTLSKQKSKSFSASQKRSGRQTPHPPSASSGNHRQGIPFPEDDRSRGASSKSRGEILGRRPTTADYSGDRSYVVNTSLVDASVPVRYSCNSTEEYGNNSGTAKRKKNTTRSRDRERPRQPAGSQFTSLGGPVYSSSATTDIGSARPQTWRPVTAPLPSTRLSAESEGDPQARQSPSGNGSTAFTSLQHCDRKMCPESGINMGSDNVSHAIPRSQKMSARAMQA